MLVLHLNYVYYLSGLYEKKESRWTRCNTLKTLGIIKVVLQLYMYIDIKRDTKVFSYTSIIILCLLRRFTAYL